MTVDIPVGLHLLFRKKTWVTAEILDLCDRRRKLKKKQFEPEGSEKYREVNNIKRCIKKGKRKLDRRTVQ